MNMSEVQLAVY